MTPAALTPAEAASADALIRLALAEDLGDAGDRTSLATIPEATQSRAAFVARAVGVVAGLPVAEGVCRAVSAELAFAPAVTDGSPTARGTVLATVSGPLRAILAAERTALELPPAPEWCRDPDAHVRRCRDGILGEDARHP